MTQFMEICVKLSCWRLVSGKLLLPSQSSLEVELDTPQLDIIMFGNLPRDLPYKYG